MLEKIINTLKNIYVTITDVAKNMCGWDGSIFHTNNYLTNKISNMFEDSKVEVIIYESKIPQHYTYPGETIMGSPWVLKFKSIPDWMTLGLTFFIDNIINILGTIEAIVRGLLTPRNDEIIFNPITKKFRLQFKYCRSYVSSALKDILTEEELTAMILQDVGDNSLILYSIISETLSYSWLALFFVRFIDFKTLAQLHYEAHKSPENITPNEFWNNSINRALPSDENPILNPLARFSGHVYKPFLKDNVLFNEKTKELNPKGIIEYIAFIMIGLIVVRTITVYYRRRKTVFADEFPIKLGYGEPFHSATVKLHSFLKGEVEKFKKSQEQLNVVDRILHKLRNGVYLKFQNELAKQGLDDTIDYDTREQLIKEKTSKYQSNINNNLINRTDSIGTDVPNKIRTLQIMDKIHNKITGNDKYMG